MTQNHDGHHLIRNSYDMILQLQRSCSCTTAVVFSDISAHLHPPQLLLVSVLMPHIVRDESSVGDNYETEIHTANAARWLAIQCQLYGTASQHVVARAAGLGG